MIDNQYSQYNLYDFTGTGDWNSFANDTTLALSLALESANNNDIDLALDLQLSLLESAQSAQAVRDDTDENDLDLARAIALSLESVQSVRDDTYEVIREFDPVPKISV